MVANLVLKYAGYEDEFKDMAGPDPTKDPTIWRLKCGKTASGLSEIEQSLRPSVLDSVKACFDAFSKQELLKHEDSDAKLIIATCICEITRITAPEAPYSDGVLRGEALLAASQKPTGSFNFQVHG